MKPNNKGYEIEAAMKKWFKGKSHPFGCVDFQTKTSLYEVKSCRLFNGCVNGNHKRNFSKKQHSKIHTKQLGRFFVDNFNHKYLGGLAKAQKKIPKYIFAVVVGKQKIWCTKSWSFVDKFISKEDGITTIRIKDIFGEMC